MDYIDFKRKYYSDAEFARKFADCTSAEQLAERAREEGFAFSAQEALSNTEVTTEELAATAGGITRNQVPDLNVILAK